MQLKPVSVSLPHSRGRLKDGRMYATRLEGGDVCIVPLSTYRDPRTEIWACGKRTGFCVLRGSRQGVRLGSFDDRRYAYEYAFATYLGRWVARRMLRIKKSVVVLRLRANRPNWWVGRFINSSAENCFSNTLDSSFSIAVGEERDRRLVVERVSGCVIFINRPRYGEFGNHEWLALNGLLSQMLIASRAETVA